MTDSGDPKAKQLTRREVLQGAAALFGSAAIACADDGADGRTEGELTPQALLRNVDTFVVLMMENRTFDHFLGSLQLLEGREVDGLTGAEHNPNADGSPVMVGPSANFTTLPDPPHGWDAARGQFNAGHMDGFVAEYLKEGAAADPHSVMSYYTREQLPVSYALADGYALCNRWFASVMGPTWPNRFFLHCATSGGQKSNVPTSLRGILEVLDEADIPCGYYSSNLPFVLTYGYSNSESTKDISQFYAEAAAGKLPALTIVDPLFTAFDAMGNDDHPPADVRDGQAFIASVHDALAKSPQWKRSMLVVLYDEHGGFYDHVAPPETADDLPEFRQLGFRVPAIVIGPQVKRGLVDTVFDHTSVIATIVRKFGLPALNARVAAANDLSKAIDPSYIDDPQPPIELPKLELKLKRAEAHARGDFGGQEELALLAERAGIDWRARTHEARRVIDEHAARLGSIRLI